MLVVCNRPKKISGKRRHRERVNERFFEQIVNTHYSLALAHQKLMTMAKANVLIIITSFLQVKGLDYRYTDNINFWLKSLSKLGLPKVSLCTGSI